MFLLPVARRYSVMASSIHCHSAKGLIIGPLDCELLWTIYEKIAKNLAFSVKSHRHLHFLI